MSSTDSRLAFVFFKIPSTSFGAGDFLALKPHRAMELTVTKLQPSNSIYNYSKISMMGNDAIDGKDGK